MGLVGVGIFELLILLLLGGPFGDLMGLPPGERDSNLVHAARPDSLVYVEWSERGKGTPDGEGVDGMVADPEVRAFFKRLQAAIQKKLIAEMGDFQEGQKLVGMLPQFVMSLSSRPGCLFLSMDQAGGDDLPPDAAMLASLRAGLVINGGDSADKLAEDVRSILKAGLGAPVEKLDHYTVPLPAPIKLEIHRHGNYLIVGIGENVIADVVRRLDARAGGLAENERFVAEWNELSIKRTSSILFLDAQNGLQTVKELLGPQGAMVPVVMGSIGLDGVTSVMTVSGVVDGHVRSNSRVRVNGDQKKGVLSLLAGRPLTREDFAFVPADSDMVFAVTFDGKTFSKAFREMISELAPGGEQEWDRAFAEFEETFELSIEKDVFESFGQAITLSNSPGDGGWFLNSVVATLEVQNPVGAMRTVSAIAEYADKHSQPKESNERFLKRGTYLERKTFMGQRIYMFNIIGEDVPFAPCFAVNKERLMFALHPQPLKSRIRRMQGKNWRSFADSFKPTLQGEAVGFTFVRTRKLVADLYGFAPWLAQIFFSQVQRERFEMDSFDFPSAQAVLPYMSDTHMQFVRTKDGFRLQSDGPPFVRGSIAAPVLGLPWVLFGVRARPMGPVLLEAAEPDAPQAIR